LCEAQGECLAPVDPSRDFALRMPFPNYSPIAHLKTLQNLWQARLNWRITFGRLQVGPGLLGSNANGGRDGIRPDAVGTTLPQTPALATPSTAA
jgi:hypothetical protein